MTSRIGPKAAPPPLGVPAAPPTPARTSYRDRFIGTEWASASPAESGLGQSDRLLRAAAVVAGLIVTGTVIAAALLAGAPR